MPKSVGEETTQRQHRYPGQAICEKNRAQGVRPRPPEYEKRQSDDKELIPGQRAHLAGQQQPEITVSKR